MKKSETCLNKTSVKNNKNLPLLILVALFAISYFFTTFFDIFGLNYYDLHSNYNLFQELRDSASNSTLGNFDLFYYTFAYSQTSLCEVVFGIVFAVVSFDFLLNKNKLYTHLSFAKSRKSVYISKTAIPLICGGIIITAVKLISAIANGVYLGVTSNLVRGIIASTLTSLMLFTMGYAITVIAHLFTGRRVEAYMFMASALTLPNAIESTVINTFSAKLSGFAPQDYYSYEPISNEVKHFFEYANPTYYITDYSVSGEYISVKDFVSFKDEYIISILWLCIFIGSLVLCGRYFSGKFKPENVGTKAKSKLVTIISSISIPLFVTQQANRTSYYTIYNAQNMYAIIMGVSIAILIVMAVIISMLITRSAKSSLWGAIGGGATGVMQIIVLIIAVTGCFGFTTRIPDTEDIEAVTVILPYTDITYNGENDFFYNNNPVDPILLTENGEFDIVRNIHKAVLEESDDKANVTFDVTYKLKNGKSINRTFQYINEKSAKQCVNLWDTAAVQEEIKGILNQQDDSYYKPYKTGSTYSFSTINPDEYASLENILDIDNYRIAVDAEAVMLISKDMKLTDLSNVTENDEALPQFSTERTKELMAAICKDAEVLSGKEWFAPEKELGALAFCEYRYANESTDAFTIFNVADAVFYINSNMKNTLAVLDKYDYTKYFECKKDIVAAHFVDVNDVARWVQEKDIEEYGYYDVNVSTAEKGLHGTYFSQDNGEINPYMSKGCNYKSINIFSVDGEVKEVYFPETDFNENESVYKMTTQEKITDLAYAKNLVKKSFLAYNVGNHGRFLVVKFTDGTQAMLVVPEKNQ